MKTFCNVVDRAKPMQKSITPKESNSNERSIVACFMSKGSHIACSSGAEEQVPGFAPQR